MKNPYIDGHIYKPLMAGLIAGYAATIINLFYDLAFTEYTKFPLHEIINVSSIIFATLILLFVASVVYSFFDRYFKNGAVIYTVLSSLFSLFCVYGAMHVQRSPDPVVTNQFHYLLLGMSIITGVFATIGIPYLVKHPGVYTESN